jgi:cytosine/adenosine deaminase-related metal-dependent hydrolase
MTQATETDLTKVAQANIPLIICPRSNNYFNLTPPYQLIKKTKISVLLGTDNAMLTPPDILQEMHYLQQQTSLFTQEELLNMITYTPRKALNLDDNIPGLNLPRSFVVLHRQSLEPLKKLYWLRGKP